MSIELAFGLVGFATGALLGARNQTADPNFPLLTGGVLGAACYAAAQALIVLLGILTFLGLLWVLIRYSNVIAEVLNSFARASGGFWGIRNFVERGVRMTDEFERRQAFLNQLPMDEKERVKLQDNDRARFSRAIDELGVDLSYLPDMDKQPGGDPETHFEDMFDLE